MDLRQPVASSLALLALGALFALAATPGRAALHIIDQVNLTFSPDSINVEVGDTVQWNHSLGIHTVTNGEGAADPNAGILFDEALTDASPMVTYTFDTAGRVPYFCRPHEIVDMKGVIIVEPATSAVGPDINEQAWGRVKALYR